VQARPTGLNLLEAPADDGGTEAWVPRLGTKNGEQMKEGSVTVDVTVASGVAEHP
jgi:hypothetical protein